MVRDNGWIDAHVFPAKTSGAFDSTLTLPGNRTVTFVLMSYQGSVGDVMTLAHELGHAVHGLLTGEAQSPLMADYPMAYAETASVFGERLVFERLQAKLRAEGKDKALLALLCGKVDDSVNTIVRQISFSNFERRVHDAGRRLSVEELSKIWLEVTAELYGADGEVFAYRDMDLLWSYVSHFQRPFYVYSYAFGNELVDSLYARRGDLGERFVPLYLGLLGSGGTKDAVELLQPFGLDPTAPDFWEKGIEAGLGDVVQRAETLARKLGYKF
jgi:oligoendopeptidase F